MSKRQVAIFEGKQIRRVWDDAQEKWYFSVSDVIAVLTDSVDALAYWRKLKERLKKEGGEQTVTKCHGLKLTAADGKLRIADVADTETMFRIIQSIPSPKAEPFKLWLARVGYERVQEAEDPELGIQRALHIYIKKGYTPEWVNLRLKSIEIRKDLTDEWMERGVHKNEEFALLTDDITFAWAGLRTKDYKRLKTLKKENLRDNMTNLELVLTMLAEASTTEISKKEMPETFLKNRYVARRGGGVAKAARKQIEKETKSPVVTSKRFEMPAKKSLIKTRK